ncbi:MAG: hypothetical protein GY877_08390 [Hyphomicrobium sp.]|jgi:hypothetical protein|nr:hypothetical protein [Hyphomicrobium sp.]
MNSFNTQLQIEDMYDQDDYSYWALLEYCEHRKADEVAQDLHWENVWMEINNEYQDNQPQPW